MLSLILFTAFSTFDSSAFAQNPPPNQNPGSYEQILDEHYRRKYAQPGCAQTMLQNTSNSLSTSLKSQSDEANALLQLSQKYFDHEQRCGNDLAQNVSQLNGARAEHEDKLLRLPGQIELQKIEYEEALLGLKQECEDSSGSVFTEWKQMAASGVITPERGGPMALFSRGKNINQYRKLFFDNCLASETNIKRAELLAKKLATNIRLLQDEIDSSAQKLNALSKDLAFKEGEITKNCMKAREHLNYQEALIQNNLGATNSAARTMNFLNMLNGTFACLSGPGNSIFGSGSSPRATQ